MPVLPQEIWYQPLPTFTGSSKFIVMFASCAICASLAAGEVPNISGGKSPVGQLVVGEEVLRGAGEPTTKFPPFESVSLQPLCVRKSAEVLSNPGAGPAPSKQLGAP